METEGQHYGSRGSHVQQSYASSSGISVIYWIYVTWKSSNCKQSVAHLAQWCVGSGFVTWRYRVQSQGKLFSTNFNFLSYAVVLVVVSFFQAFLCFIHLVLAAVDTQD